jgi:ribose 1,5-bisphosphokinase PhnN
MTGGPSGAGKDTLLLGAREALLGARAGAGVDGPAVEFIKREITRDASKTTDLEIPVSVAEFDARRVAGHYAVSWEAHGTKYAIPRASLEAALQAGKPRAIGGGVILTRPCIFM